MVQLYHGPVIPWFTVFEGPATGVKFPYLIVDSDNIIKTFFENQTKKNVTYPMKAYPTVP